MIRRICINKILHYKGICDGCGIWMDGKFEELDDAMNRMKANGWKVTTEGNHYCDECKRTIQPTDGGPARD